MTARGGGNKAMNGLKNADWLDWHTEDYGVQYERNRKKFTLNTENSKRH